MRESHYGRMRFKSVKTLGCSTFLAVENDSASSFFTVKNVELLGLYPIRIYSGSKMAPYV